MAEAKLFYTDLEAAFNRPGPARRDAMRRDATMVAWFDAEPAFNDAETTYDDAVARTFGTRYFERFRDPASVRTPG